MRVAGNRGTPIGTARRRPLRQGSFWAKSTRRTEGSSLDWTVQINYRKGILLIGVLYWLGYVCVLSCWEKQWVFLSNLEIYFISTLHVLYTKEVNQVFLVKVPVNLHTNLGHQNETSPSFYTNNNLFFPYYAVSAPPIKKMRKCRQVKRKEKYPLYYDPEVVLWWNL